MDLGELKNKQTSVQKKITERRDSFQHRGKIFTNHMADRGLIFKIYK